MNITNNNGIDLALAVWLLQDGYNSGADKAPPGELISVTSLMKPTKQQILQRRVDYTKVEADVADFISRRMGHSLHDSIELAWRRGNWRAAMRALHYPNSVIERVIVNPPMDKPLPKDAIPVYLEQRGFRRFEDIVLTGQLDFVLGSSYKDTKSTSVFSYMSDSKDEDYIIQGSLYRSIFPNIIKDDVMRINFIFTDWVKYMANNSKNNYPKSRVAHKDFPLMSLAETDKWISSKLAEIRANAKKPQSTMVRCTDKELWRSNDTYMYYAKKETADAGGRCTKRFDSLTEAITHQQAKGKGVVITDPGQVKACTYCTAFTVCEQRKEYFTDDQEPIT